MGLEADELRGFTIYEIQLYTGGSNPASLTLIDPDGNQGRWCMNRN